MHMFYFRFAMKVITRTVRAMVVAVVLLFPLSALAKPHELTIPLHDGQIRLADLSDGIQKSFNCKKSYVTLPGIIDVRGAAGSTFVEALNESLGEGCRIDLRNSSLIVHIDRDKLPKDWDNTRFALRLFTSVAAPESTAAQNQQYGLHLPRQIDTKKPLVILVHGLDCNKHVWSGLLPLLNQDGYQIATFSYPPSAGIADSGKLLAKHLAAVRETFPELKMQIVAHSMGALVTRSYIESKQYAGGVHDLIMLAPPNHGSKWAYVEIVPRAVFHYHSFRNDPQWRWTWMITDGFGEAARDLMPDSNFIRELNSKPRRNDVQYTTIAGDAHPVYDTAAKVVGAPSRWFPRKVANLWGFRHLKNSIEKASSKLASHKSNSDGPVSIASTKLDGVDDYVIVHADHNDMINWVNNQPPVTWKVIQDRLNRP